MSPVITVHVEQVDVGIVVIWWHLGSVIVAFGVGSTHNEAISNCVLCPAHGVAAPNSNESDSENP